MRLDEYKALTGGLTPKWRRLYELLLRAELHHSAQWLERSYLARQLGQSRTYAHDDQALAAMAALGLLETRTRPSTSEVVGAVHQYRVSHEVRELIDTGLISGVDGAVEAQPVIVDEFGAELARLAKHPVVVSATPEDELPIFDVPRADIPDWLREADLAGGLRDD